MLLKVFIKSSCKSVNVVGFKKALAKSLAIFIPEQSRLLSHSGFCTGTMSWSTPAFQSRSSKGCEGVKTISYPLYLPDIAPGNLILRCRVMLELAGVLLPQESINNDLGWGCSKPSLKTSLPSPFGSRWTVAKSPP